MFLPDVVFALLSWIFILKFILKKSFPVSRKACIHLLIHIIPGSSARGKNEDEDNNMDKRYSHSFKMTDKCIYIFNKSNKKMIFSFI